MIEEFEGPQTARGQKGLAYVVRGGPKQLYVETDDNTLYFQSSESTEKEWVLIEVTLSATRDPRAPEHAGYDRVVPKNERRVPPLKPKVVEPEAKPAAPPSAVALELMQYTNHFYIRNLAAKVDELLGKDAVDVVVGDPLQLEGDTVEVKFSVREKDKADTVIAFVAHYHADATGASTAARDASQQHLKKWTNSWAYKDVDLSATKYPNLFRLLPKRKAALSNARPYKSGELLYSPKK